MSVTTWKKEFYSVGASTVARDKTKTVIDLIDHCIVKWQGALPENTAKHSVVYSTSAVFDSFGFSLNNPVFHFSSSTCALCQRFERRVNCNGCPLAIARDGTPCYKYSSKYDTKDQSDSRWGSDSVYWNSRNNPKPMIEQLKKAKKIMLKEIK